MTAPSDAARQMIADIEHLTATLPTRIPTMLRVGRTVRAMLSDGSKSAKPPLNAGPLFGVDVLPDPAYGPGEWRLFDQWGDELHSGHLWPPDLPVYESVYLPAGTHAVVFTPPPDADLGPTEPWVIVRAAGNG